MMAGPKHVILGAGTAGFNAITTLLEKSPGADVTLVSSELPYARMVLPYYLSSQIEEENVFTLTVDQLAQMGVRTVFGDAAVGLDRASKELKLQSGATVPYDDLLIATGSSALRPPVAGINGDKIYDHWTLADTQALRQVMHIGSEVTIVGAGFIAFTLVNPLLHAGCKVTLVEREPSVLPRMLNTEAAELLAGWMRERGTRVYTGAELQRIEDTPNGRKRLVISGMDAPVEADFVIVATGITPNVAWLNESGLDMKRGLVVDEHLRTSDPNIYAAGDIAEVIDPFSGQRAIMAIETAAMEQGRIIGSQMAGQSRTYGGGMLMNVVEAAGLQASSFGNWLGADVTEGKAAGGHYRRYVWQGDTLVGGVLVGPARRVAAENDMGMLKGIIQAGQPLGEWKDLLVKHPFELKKVFLATRTVAHLLPRTLLGAASRPLGESLAAAANH